VSSRPERTRISCCAALGKAAYAPFCKERRMKYIKATRFHRKSGGAKWRTCCSSFELLTLAESPALHLFLPIVPSVVDP
jgi:hypothetical protein